MSEATPGPAQAGAPDALAQAIASAMAADATAPTVNPGTDPESNALPAHATSTAPAVAIVAATPQTAPITPSAPTTPSPPRTATGPWRWVHSSVRGSAHVENGLPCQDASAATAIEHPNGSVLVLVAADGAGSARCAERGSRLVCDEVVAAVTRWLANGGDPARMDTACPAQWLGEVQAALRAAATAAGDQPRDWASTLIAAVLFAGRGLFFQIGDGAVVADGVTEAPVTDNPTVAEAATSTPTTEPLQQSAADTATAPAAITAPAPAAPAPVPPPAPGPWNPVFWPDSGAYANCTYFVSDADATAHLRIAMRTAVTEVALFSDGLHAIALHHASRSAFAPFFTPLFARLRREAGGPAAILVPALAELLDSPGIRKRADDDRTLVLATRLA